MANPNPKNPHPKIVLTEKEIDMIERMAGLGLKNAQIAAILEISRETLRNRSNEDPRVKEAIRRGRAKSSHTVMQTAFNMATSGQFPAMTMFWLKCRENWREKSDLPTEVGKGISTLVDLIQGKEKPAKTEDDTE